MFCKCVPLYIGKSEDNFSCSILLKKGLFCFYLVGHYLPSCHRSTGIKNALPHPLVKWLWESPQVSRLDWLILLLDGPSPWPRSVTCIQKLIVFFFFFSCRMSIVGVKPKILYSVCKYSTTELYL